MPRALASVQRIRAIAPIPDADAIEVATVRGWKVVVKKNELAVGDLAVYVEIDAFLPEEPAYEFLRKSSFKTLPSGRGGFRLRTAKLRGQVSQGLLLPLDVLPAPGHAHEGDDVTEALGIVLYEPPMPVSDDAKGTFPSFVPKTDEERIQNLPDLFEAARPTEPLYVTEKLDGSSFTAYLRDRAFGVCSRNLELLDTPTSAFWKAARSLGLEDKLRATGRNLAVQGELVGPGIQSNTYKMDDASVYFFSAVDLDTYTYLPFEEMRALFGTLGLPMVPLLDEAFVLPETMEAMLAYADGPSALRGETAREGVVVRSYDRSVSFKAISNRFLLKQG
ncbi:MAG: RNA ligase (ATP) [Bacteroidetes bacterium]|nr:RNA ligase (ATP) [Bacteroidota bacterium]